MKMDAEQTFIKTVADEMASAVCEAVGYWMADVDATLADESTSAHDKVNEIRNIVAAYKALSEKPNCGSAVFHRAWHVAPV